MNFRRVYWTAVILIVFIFAVFIYLYLWGPWSTLPQIEKIAISQLYFTAFSSIAIVFTLIYATVQFRRASAKPLLKIVFTESGTNETAIYTPPQTTNMKIPLDIYVYNNGNIVSDFYQVEFELPNIFEPYLHDLKGKSIYPIGSYKTSKDSLELARIPFYANRQAEYASFVGKCVKIGTLALRIVISKKEEYPINFRIRYRIFGDWASTQEGTLRVNLNVNWKI